jgi:[acyl-carrier-protein] S-malonyltransferase
MISKSVILCPGQGAQAVEMGKAWVAASEVARQVFADADRVLGTRLGAPLSELCFQGPAERLNQTDVSQPAIYTTSVACWRALCETKYAQDRSFPAATAGLSLGEYTALHIAGAMSFEDGLELVTLRGRAMQDAAMAPGVAGKSGMVALIGATDEQAAEICSQARGQDVLVCANFNAPGQVVLSGHSEACERAASIAQNMSLRASILAVAGAFHSPLMAPAADRLQTALKNTHLTAPHCAVISNVTAQPHGDDPETIRRLLVEQLTSPVRWAQSCVYLASKSQAASGLDFVEVAPGKTLMGLMRRIEKGIKVTSHDAP